MKKFLSILLLLTLGLTLTGCHFVLDMMGFTNSAGGNSEPSVKETVEIIVYDGDNPFTFDVEIGKEAKIDSFTKPGYYLEGYFDSMEGGRKYFYISGTSLLEWEKSFPTTFYARWSSIDELLFSDNREGPYIGPQYFGQSHVNFKFELPAEFRNGVRGNLDKT